MCWCYWFAYLWSKGQTSTLGNNQAIMNLHFNSNCQTVKLLLAFFYIFLWCPILMLSLDTPATVIQDEAMKGVD